ncbi:MAG: peptide/nickel transport system ATP-binding protein [Halobacteriales archaeon]|jgi:peptide/nickel transport system ATP-binding protein
MMTDPLLAVRDLEKHYPVRRGLLRREVGRVRAVDGIDFNVYPDETVALVGESGSGKSTAAETILNLDEPTGGTIRFDGRDVTEFSGNGNREFRRRTGVVFQNPNESLDPRMRVWQTVAEPLEIHGVRDQSDRRREAERMLGRVGLEGEADSYPHELSGGQKQRVSLARALILNPDLLIADEPVSALDVSIQADVLSLIEELKAEFDLAVLFISHDLAIIREIADRVAVMYAGELVEVADAETLFEKPQHPYTRVLLDAIPTTDPAERGQTAELGGEVPDPADPPAGCRFHPRCPTVVAPEDLDVPAADWQSVFEFQVALEAGTVDGNDPTTVRAEYDLDDMPSAVVGTVDEAVEAVVTGEDERAVEILRDAFQTPCTREDPSLRKTPPGHRAACHHYDPGD